MLKNRTINLKVIEEVATALGDLNKEVIYVGGAVVSLYVTDEGAEQPRPTKDIDISVQISSLSEMDVLREKLASKNIYPNPESKILYRYKYKDVLIDFIPFKATALGPTNSWLEPGFKKAYPIIVGDTRIKILPVSLYMATKWEAFNSRGSDPRMSHDFEDIIYVIDNNLAFVEDVANANKEVQLFLKSMSNYILTHKNSLEIIECHINPFTASERGELIIEKLIAINKL